MKATHRDPSATPLARRKVGRLAHQAGGAIERLGLATSRQVGRRAIVVSLNVFVAAIVMSLPFIASSAAQRSPDQTVFASAPIGSTSLAADAVAQVARAVTQARGATIVAGRSPVTAQAEAVRSIGQYTLSANDTLWTIANFYGLSAEAVAFANGITDPYHLQVGREIMIPPSEGALYTVAEGDTVDSVAARFKVDPTVIRDYNRMRLESQHFAPGQLIFVENAVLPTLPLPPGEASAQSSVIARAGAPAPAAKNSGGGTLPWPVAGYISQYMWGGHTGVDIAAPYGTGLAAGVSGVISENGWVPVGGLHICVTAGNLQECFYHMSAAYYSVGTAVDKGQIIGAIGLTGVTSGPHVHWETKIDGRFVNPLGVQQ